MQPFLRYTLQTRVQRVLSCDIAKVAIIESTESTENWRTAFTENWRTAYSGAAEVHSAGLQRLHVIESTESTENWRTALSGAAVVHSACKGCNNRVLITL